MATFITSLKTHLFLSAKYGTVTLVSSSASGVRGVCGGVGGMVYSYLFLCFSLNIVILFCSIILPVDETSVVVGL